MYFNSFLQAHGVRSLTLSGNKLGHAGFALFCEAVLHARTLRTLDISGNELTCKVCTVYFVAA